MTEQQEHVWAIVKKWAPRLGLNNWQFKITIKAGYHPDEPDCQADVQEYLKYHEADLTIYKSFWEDDARRQEITIIHELSHLVLCRLHSHLSPSGDDVVEETTQSIAMLIFNAYAQ